MVDSYTYVSSLSIHMLWSTVSNAALRSSAYVYIFVTWVSGISHNWCYDCGCVFLLSFMWPGCWHDWLNWIEYVNRCVTWLGADWRSSSDPADDWPLHEIYEEPRWHIWPRSQRSTLILLMCQPATPLVFELCWTWSHLHGLLFNIISRGGLLFPFNMFSPVRKFKFNQFSCFLISW